MANLNLSEFTEKLFVADADHTFIWDTVNAISKRVSRNSWLSGTTADFHLGLADAATAVAQTISVQSVVAGTSNTAGANLSINGSQGTGTGAGGSLLLRTAPAGSSGTAQNALVTAVAITSAGNVGIGTTSPTSKLHVAGDAFLAVNGSNTAPSLRIGAGANINGWYSFGGLQLNAVINSANVFGISASGTNIAIGNLSFGGSADVVLEREAQDELALRRGALGQKFSVYGTYPGAAWERFTITAPTSGNVLLGTYKGTGGIARGLEFQTDGVTRMTIASGGATTFSSTITGTIITATNFIGVPAGNGLIPALGGGSDFIKIGNNSGSELARVGYFGTAATSYISFGGVANTSPALKRSTTYLQARLADDSAFAPIQGKLTTDTAYTATVVAATGYITIYDSTGTAYRVPCAV